MVSRRFPPWLVKRMPSPSRAHGLKALMRQKRLYTVCEEARCPNLFECFSRGTATFMIGGDVCTRTCGYCAVTKGAPEPLDRDEPRHVAEAAFRLNLNHVVVTMVNRDDLADGAAGHVVATIEAIREALLRDDEELTEVAKAGKIFLMLILTAMSMEYPPDYIFEAIILGGLSRATRAEADVIEGAREYDRAIRVCNTSGAVDFKDSWSVGLGISTFAGCFDELPGKGWGETCAAIERL